jgi:hypothetical protein
LQRFSTCRLIPTRQLGRFRALLDAPKPKLYHVGLLGTLQQHALWESNPIEAAWGGSVPLGSRHLRNSHLHSPFFVFHSSFALVRVELQPRGEEWK